MTDSAPAPSPVVKETTPPEPPAAPPAPPAGAQQQAPEPHRQPEFTQKLRTLVEGTAKPKVKEVEPLLGDLRTQLATINATQQQLQQASQAVQELQGQILQGQGQVDAIGRIIHRLESA